MYYRLAGDGSPRVVAEVLGWLREELPRRDVIRADAVRLAEIQGIEREVLTGMQRARAGCCGKDEGACC